uniref:Uncharacterized protein n=1 Tax=Anopheles funestus TaxID=62324 RepID=A0A182S383_ANOFN
MATMPPSLLPLTVEGASCTSSSISSVGPLLFDVTSASVTGFGCSSERTTVSSTSAVDSSSRSCGMVRILLQPFTRVYSRNVFWITAALINMYLLHSYVFCFIATPLVVRFFCCFVLHGTAQFCVPPRSVEFNWLLRHHRHSHAPAHTNINQTKQ